MDHKLTFERPYRTLGMRVLNRAGTALRSWGWRRPLCSDEIIRTAQRRTGLTKFDDVPVREPLDLLVECLEAENPTPMGRRMLRDQLVHCVANRLRHQAWVT